MHLRINFIDYQLINCSLTIDNINSSASYLRSDCSELSIVVDVGARPHCDNLKAAIARCPRILISWVFRQIWKHNTYFQFLFLVIVLFENLQVLLTYTNLKY